jgi:hypothetical protein
MLIYGYLFCCSFHPIYLGSRRHGKTWEPLLDASRRVETLGGHLVYINSGHDESAQSEW